tara:strand:+ start:239 stop:469 length:231 start_codon:yes stop_codon:yes gene_type:complete
MKRKLFLEKLYDELEIESINQLSVDTILHDLDEWDSLTLLSLISFIENEFSINLSAEEIEKFVKLKDLTDRLKLNE